MKIFASTPSSSSTSTDTVDHPMNIRDKQRRITKFIQNNDDLATFLLNRACQNDELANYFFWYLCVECEGGKSFGSSTTTAATTATASSGGNNNLVEPKSSSSTPTTNVSAYP
ncbi:hypothetical protein BLA29_013548, partial [Euroglyphus maynei]